MKRRTKVQLEKELAELRRKVAELEAPQARPEESDALLPHEGRSLQEGYDAIGVTVVFVDAEGRIALINKRGREVLGYEEEEILGEKWFDLCCPPTVARERAMDLFHLLMAGATDSVEYYESPVLTKSGGERTILWHNAVMKDAEGKATGVLCSGEDITDRKRAERELRYRAHILDQSEAGVNLVDAHDGTLLHVNAQFSAMLGYEPGELVGKHISVVNAPGEKDPAETAAEIMQCLNDSGRWNGEIRNIRKDGSIVWCHAKVARVDHPEYGEVWASVHEDITERKRAEEALAESEALYRSLFENSLEGIGLAKGNRIVSANRAILDIFGYDTFKEFVQVPLLEHVAPESREMIAERLARKTRGERLAPRYEYRILRKDGEIRDLEISTAEVVLGGEEYVQSTFRDITDRKRAEEALQESERRFRTLFENAPIGLGVTKADGALLAFNDAIARMTGYSHAELERLNVGELYQSSDDRGRLLERLRTDGAVRGFEVTLKRKDGTPYHASLTVVPFALGGEDAVLTVVEDITERKRLEKEILDICARERRRIGEDLHDGLGQHLTGVALLSKALAGKLAAHSSPEAAEAAKIEALVNQTISWTRDLARAAHPVDPAPEGLMSALQTMASGEEELLGVSCVFCCDQPILLHDNSVATHLYRMAQEALSNAVRHGKAKHVEISLARVEDGIRLEVTDDGEGIPEPLEEDKGMGLRIMAYRARMIGGALDIRRRPTGGTMVVCTVRPGPGP